MFDFQNNIFCKTQEMTDLQGLSLELIFSISLVLWLGSSIVINVGGNILVYIVHFDTWLLK